MIYTNKEPFKYQKFHALSLYGPIPRVSAIIFVKKNKFSVFSYRLNFWEWKRGNLPKLGLQSYFVSRDVLSLSKQCFLCKYGAMVVGSGGPNWMAELAKATNLLYCIGIWITWEWNSNGHELLPCYFHVFKNCLLRMEEFR